MWQSTDATVRDLHRAMLPAEEKHIAPSQSADELSLADRYRLYPAVGTASQTAQPGGFRRAHLKAVLEESGQELEGYAATPLAVHLDPQRRGPMLTGATLTLSDGTTIKLRSRAFRKGRRPQVLHLPDGSTPVSQQERFHLWRPRSIPYWGAVTFLVGAILFTEGSFAWMLPNVGDTAHGADPQLAEETVGYPFFAGAPTPRVYYLSICLSIYLSNHVSICLYLYLIYVCEYVYICVYTYTSISIYVSV